MDGGIFDSGDTDPALAVAEAFAQALTAMFPAQAELFADEGGWSDPVQRAGADLFSAPGVGAR